VFSSSIKETEIKTTVRYFNLSSERKAIAGIG
jgi:hypothetical protein